jgi:hypothetical protein
MLDYAAGVKYCADYEENIPTKRTVRVTWQGKYVGNSISKLQFQVAT